MQNRLAILPERAPGRGKELARDRARLGSESHMSAPNTDKPNQKAQLVKRHKFLRRFFFAERRRKEKAIKKKRRRGGFALCGGRGGLRALHRASF